MSTLVNQINLAFDEPLAGTYSINTPADLQDGDLLLFITGSQRTSYTTEQHIAPPTGFTELEESRSTSRSAQLFYRQVTVAANEPAAFDFDISLSGVRAAVHLIAIRNPPADVSSLVFDDVRASDGNDNVWSVSADSGGLVVHASLRASSQSTPVYNPDPLSFERTVVSAGEQYAISGYATAYDSGNGLTATDYDVTVFSSTGSSTGFNGGYIVAFPGSTAGITITEIKEPNEANILVDGVTNARVKVWFGNDAGEEDRLYNNENITNGTLTIDEVDGGVGDTVLVEVMWTVGSERKLFITETTLIEGGS